MPGKTTTNKLTPDVLDKLIIWEYRIMNFEAKISAPKSFEAWRDAYWHFFHTTTNIAELKKKIYSEYEHPDLPIYEWEQFAKELDNTKWAFRNAKMPPLDALMILLDF